MTRRIKRRPFTWNEHEQLIHEDGRRIAEQREWSRRIMKMYDVMPKDVRQASAEDTKFMRIYYEVKRQADGR